MTPVSYSALRQNLAHYMDETCGNHDPILVTRQGADSVVLMSLAEFEGLMETVHLLRSPVNARRLLDAIDSAEAGELASHEIAE